MKKQKNPPAVQTAFGKITPQEAAAKAREIELARVQSVTPADSAQIMASITNQAKNGNLQAAEMFFRLMSPSGFPTPTEDEQERKRPVGSMVQVNVGGNDNRRVAVVSIDRAGLQVAQLLMNAGPLSQKRIVSTLNVPADRLAELEEEGVIKKNNRGRFQLTEAGRQAAEQTAEG